ncbi:MAG: acyl-CoA reductase [Flavobacteriales bacterium]|mgnify:CR=1 FL=1|nr:acyl-CoA reductase [Flavobacteriales bacterium]
MLALRIKSFVELGNQMKEALGREDGEFQGLNKQQINLLLQVRKSGLTNGWFTKKMVSKALDGIMEMLNEKHLEKWLDVYVEEIKKNRQNREVGLIMAGNIPAVGFHDFLCVLISGHTAVVKTSSDDECLIPSIADLLISIDSSFSNKINILSRPRSNYDAVIATGSNNSARYFNQYFGKYPNIIRKSRTSVAVLTGKESDGEISGLAKDMFTYYGLGCRNVSKLLVTKDFDSTKLIDELLKHTDFLKTNGKYQNNIDYNKSIFIINKVSFLDGGTFLLKEDKGLHSPIGVTFYEKFDSMEAVKKYVKENEDEIQCVVSSALDFGVPFGETQTPKVWDYADKIDTLEFLINL